MYTIQRYQSTVKASPVPQVLTNQNKICFLNQSGAKQNTSVRFPALDTGYLLWPQVLIGSLLFAFVLIGHASLPWFRYCNSHQKTAQTAGFYGYFLIPHRAP